MITDEKQTMRVAMRARLREMTVGERASAAAVISRRVREVVRGAGGGLVFGFAPMGSEPDWFAGGEELPDVAFPRVVGERLEFVVVEPGDELETGRFGVREPRAGRVVRLADAAVILVPGLAFDRAGNRLGRGGGYYDRLLGGAGVEVLKVGIAFERQVVTRVPTEALDVRVDRVLTEGEGTDG
ncbi:MAG: 5-formyltetrahydrofolate cyclo-ligase [Chthoniobacterales bacterium]